MSDQPSIKRWKDLLTDPKTIVAVAFAIVSAAFTGALGAYTWLQRFNTIEVEKLNAFLKRVELTEDTIVFKANRDIAFKSSYWTFIMQPDGNFTIYDKDSNKSDPRFNARVIAHY